MTPSPVNESGVLTECAQETVASHGHSSAKVRIALCADQRFRKSVSLMYSYGGFSFPISIESESFATYAQALDAGLQELLKHWHTPFASDPTSVHEELRQMREQVLARIRQPSLF